MSADSTTDSIDQLIAGLAYPASPGGRGLAVGRVEDDGDTLVFACSQSSDSEEVEQVLTQALLTLTDYADDQGLDLHSFMLATAEPDAEVRPDLVALARFAVEHRIQHLVCLDVESLLSPDPVSRGLLETFAAGTVTVHVPLVKAGRG